MTIYQVTHKMTWELQQCRNVYYYDTNVGEPSKSEWQDIVDEIRGEYNSELKTHMSAAWSFNAIDYRIVDTPGLLTFEALPTAGDLVGTGVGQSLPTQVALLVSVKGTTTKPNRARTYLSGFTETGVADSLFGATPIAAAETFVDLQSVLNFAGTNPLQRVAAQWNTSHTQVIAFNFISADPSKGSIVPATQRRRRIGVGI